MNKNIKVVSLFSGIGAYERALNNIGVDIDLVNYELDKTKSKAYALLHNVSEDLNLVDVAYIDTKSIEDFDMLVYSPPCQSYSVAGKMQGLNDIRGTLFYNALKVLQDKKPKYAIMENVDNLAKKFKVEFEDMLSELEKAGYNNYWKVINAKDFIPQNRNRVFVVSIRKDIDDGKFNFPTGNDTRHWSEVIDLHNTRSLTGRQQRMIDYVGGLNSSDKIKIRESSV